MANEIGNILDALTQRRKAQRHDIQAIVQILAEQALLDKLAQFAVGGGDDAHIGFDWHAAADGGVFTLLQHAQQARLGFQRHVADFVEKQRAAFGLFETADAAVGGAGERAALMPEQLAFDEFFRNRRHVHGDKRPGAAAAVIVQGAGDEFLARAGLAHDHHREIGLCEPCDDAIDFLHRRRAADQRQALFVALFRLRGLRLRLRRGQGALHQRGEFLQVERLGQIIERAAFGGCDGGEDGVLRTHHDDGQIGPQTLDARQKIEPALVRQHHVGNDEAALALRDPAPQARRRRRRAHVITRAAERLMQHRADRGVVIGDENGTSRHTQPSLSALGSNTRNTVRPAVESHSTTPP